MDAVELDRQVRAANSLEQVQRIVSASGFDDPELSSALGDAMAAAPPRRQALEAKVRQIVATLAALHGPIASHAPGIAKGIKSNPLYRDEGDLGSSNWLADAFSRLGKLFRPNLDPPKLDAPKLAPVGTSWLVPTMWGLLGIGVLVLAFFAFKYVRFQRRAKSKRRAMLDEDEPDRTLDQWLAEADRLAALGEHRLAVRALYVACLLKLDEHRVIRFIRGDTNWEHLDRLEASPARPAGLDFRAPTQAFDLIWYGHRVRGSEDVSAFKSWYSGLLVQLESSK